MTSALERTTGVPLLGTSGPAEVAVKEEGTTVLATVSALNFVGASVTVTDGGAGVAIITITDATLTQEQVEDFVGLLVQDSSVLDATYDDPGGAITITIKPGVVTAAMLAFDPATQTELDAAITALKNGAPAGGDTLGELDARIAIVEALGSLATDAELIAAVAALIGTADTAGDTLGELQSLIGLRMLKSANLSDVANASTARGNLGLGTAATHAHGDYEVAGAAAAIIDGQAFTGPISAPGVTISPPTALSAHITPVRFLGILDHAGPPVAADGTFSTGDSVFDNAGQEYLCTAGGTPGTWVAVGSGRLLGTAGVLQAGFTNPTAATEADVTNMTTSWVYDGRPINLRVFCPWVSHDQTTKQQIQLRIKRTQNPNDNAIQQVINLTIGAQAAGFTDFLPCYMETGPITAWPSDAAAFVVGTTYSAKLTLAPPASTKARIAAPLGASDQSIIYPISC